MINTEIINGKVFVEQTTFYVYKDENARKSDIANFVTSDQDRFAIYKETERKRKRIS